MLRTPHAPVAGTLKQHGATLITALIMLLVLTVLVISAIKSSTTNLRIAGNMQGQQENIMAAQRATEAVIANNFTLGAASGKTPASTVAVTINNVQYQPTVVAYCLGTTPLPANYPNLPVSCKLPGNYDPNNTAQTQCVSQQWDVQSTVYDPTTGAKTVLHQGVYAILGNTVTCP